MALTISDYGINLIKKFEGCRLSAYKDAAGVITIGYGWTKPIDGKPLTMGTTITQAKADALLKEGLKSYERKVLKYDSRYHWNQNQFDALVSFAYNIGSIDQLTASGTRSLAGIAEKITAYQKAGGKVLPGLCKRREAEKQLFLKPVSGSAPSGAASALPLTSPSAAPDAKVNALKANIRSVQAWLNARYKTGLAADGIFGPKTRAALLKAFQKETGCVRIDGLWGSESKTAASSHILKKGAAGILVMIWQACLICRGLLPGEIDGIFQENTHNATLSFQKAENLVQDGIVGSKTWQKAFIS